MRGDGAGGSNDSGESGPVAQWQSGRLITDWSLVRIQPGPPLFLTIIAILDETTPRSPSRAHVSWSLTGGIIISLAISEVFSYLRLQLMWS